MTVVPIRSGADLSAFSVTGPEIVTVGSRVRVRNFSRTSAGVLRATGANVFVKQFVNSATRPMFKSYEGEVQGAPLAAAVMPSSNAQQFLARSDEDLVLIYPWMEVTPTDELVRSDQDTLFRLWPTMLSYLNRCLNEAADPRPDHTRGLKQKRCETGRLAVNFKGFEVRNVGYSAQADSLCFFDTGPPYIATIDEAVARVIVSVWLLNWGKPVSRFLAGPSHELAFSLRQHLSLDASREAIDREISIQARTRGADIQATSGLIRAAKRLGLGTVGRRYVANMRRWARADIRESRR